MKLNSIIAGLIVIIVLLTLFLRGYYRVQMALEGVKEAKEKLIQLAEKRYEPLDSLVSYYRRTFSEESSFIERLDSNLKAFHEENRVAAIPPIENQIFNLKNFLDKVEAQDERLDTIRLYVYRTEKYDSSIQKAITAYNRSVEEFNRKTKGPIYDPFKRFMVGEIPHPIKVEYRLEKDYILPVETRAREEKETVLSSIVREVLDTIPEDTLKKEGGESDKSDTAGVSTPGEGEGGDSGEEGNRTS